MQTRTWTARLALLVAIFTVEPADAKIESTSEGIRFTYTNPNAQTVALAGDFNSWNPSAHPMVRQGDGWVTVVKLAPGEHEYKFVVDGQYFADPENPTTGGSFGNSILRVGAQGEILEMLATSNTPLSPKILLHGRTIGLFIGRKFETNQGRFFVGRPDFNIDLDFNVRISEVLDARVLTKIRNLTEGTQLWETSLRFDRGHLDLHRPSFALRLFDNDGVGTWSDPLHLVGDTGMYRRDYGFEQQGLRATGTWRDIVGTLLYADNFEIGDPLPPPLDTLAVTLLGYQYGAYLNDANKNVLALRLEREARPGLRLGASMRLDRGYNPGALSLVFTTDDSTRARDNFGRTNERWLGGGVDIVWRDGERASAFAEYLYGEASLRSGVGVRQFFRSRAGGFRFAGDEPMQGTRFVLDASQRWTVGGAWQPLLDVRLRAAIERERHGLAPLATDGLIASRNVALTYRAGGEFDLKPRWRVPVRLGLDLEVIDFDYTPGAPWRTQLWFADRNFWMEHFEHRLPVNRYLQLGGDDATTWSPWLEWTTWHDLVFRYDGHFFGTEIDREVKLFESLFQVTFPLTPRLRLHSNTRWVRYDDPVLAIHGGFVSTFAEVAYSFTRDISVALSVGVDPDVLDVVTNEYDTIGRNEFLIQRGATQTVARDRYLNLGSVLPRAEQALEDERRVQLEAIVRF